MFSSVSADSSTYKAKTIIVGAAVSGGIIYGMVKHKGFWGTLGIAIGFGIAGVAISIVTENISR